MMNILTEKYKILLVASLLTVSQAISVQAQSSQSIQGKVTDESGAPLENVNVGIEGTKKGNITDENGEYEITGLQAGDYTVIASSIGYQTQEESVTVRNNEVTVVNFTLIEKISTLNNITVSAESDATIKSREPITITAIDAASLNTQAIGAEDILKRSTGVLVRQEGGLGSRSSINLNGLTGNAVRIYYDGIPLQLYGGGIQVNNLPVNSIERVEVYKGVMPITVGTDALGGGINIIPKKYSHNFYQSSYEYGSFNTHRATFAARKGLTEDLSFSGNLFFNHSGNTYGMENIPNQSIEIFENDFGRIDTSIVEGITDAERFNNQHTSAYAEGNLTFSDKSWTDELTLSSAYSYRYDEYQHGPRVSKRPAGEAHSDVQSFIQRLRYDKIIGADIGVSYFGMVAFTEESVDDSTSRVYDWNGDLLPIENNRGSEILGRPSLRKGENIGTAHRLSLNYNIHPRHTFALSNFFSYSRIKGNDPVGIRLELNTELLDPNTIPSHYSRNIAGGEFQSKWFQGEQVTTTVFYKNYFYKAKSIDITKRTGDIIPVRNNRSSDHGYGTAVKWNITPNLFARSSYERTIRMPNESEIYGNYLTIRPNYIISPERSHNLNLGAFYQKNFTGDRFLSVDLNLFLRQQEDLIRLDLLAGGEWARYVNEDEVRSEGVELAIKSEPIRNLSFNTNITYQKIALASSDQVQNDHFVGVQLPNIPDFFLNSSVTYQIYDLFRGQDFFELFWNYYFVDQFSVTYVLDESNANRENIIPVQHQHNAGLSYSPVQQPLTFSFQVNNVFDNTLYDNYRVPKPGLNFAFKVNYSFN